MEKRRGRKNIILKIPKSQWINRKIKQLNAKVKATFKNFKIK